MSAFASAAFSRKWLVPIFFGPLEGGERKLLTWHQRMDSSAEELMKMSCTAHFGDVVKELTASKCYALIEHFSRKPQPHYTQTQDRHVESKLY